MRFFFLILFLSSYSFAQSQIQTDPVHSSDQKVLTTFDAAVLGVVEGISEYLPISSTGHLIIASELLGLSDHAKYSEEQIDAVKAFEIVIQSGAILAVLLLYFTRVKEMVSGLLGKNPAGKKLFINIIVAMIPTLLIGPLANKLIKTYLQSIGPVILALIIGGAIMIRWSKTSFSKKSRSSGVDVNALLPKMALFIGAMQCLAMWPGTSRSMVTILAGMIVGLTPVAAAEFSFLLGLPTLLAATVFKAYKEGHVLVTHIGALQMTVGLVVAAIVAAMSVKWLVSYLNRHGLAVFGWYRIVFGVILTLFFYGKHSL